MALVFVGEVTLALAAPGFAALSAAYAAALDDVEAVILSVGGKLSTLKGSIEASVLAEVSAQLSASLAMTLALKASVSDPSLFVATQLRGAVQVAANVKALAPSLQLSTMLSARLALDAKLAAKKAAIELLVGLIGEVAAALDAAIAAALEAVASLAAAIDFSAPGVLAYRYQGQLGQLDDELAAAFAGGQTGTLTGSTPVIAYVLAASTGNVAASGALGAALGG